MQRDWWRSTWFAAIVAPLLGGATAGATIGIIMMCIQYGPELLQLGGGIYAIYLQFMMLLSYAWVGFWVGATVGILLMVTLGVLIDRWFRKIRWTQWWVYVLAGGIGGIPLGIGSTQLFIGNSTVPLFVALACILGGAFTGGFAWRISRPDRNDSYVGAPGISVG